MKLLTFEPRSGHEGEYILRLEHIYDVGEHPILSRPVEMSLEAIYKFLFRIKVCLAMEVVNINSSFIKIKGLFKDFDIEEIEETILDGNMKRSDFRRLRWKSTNKDVDSNFDYKNSQKSLLDRVKLLPMEIRTFVIRLFPK